MTVRLFGPALPDAARFRIALESALARGLTRARLPFLPAGPLAVQPAAEWQASSLPEGPPPPLVVRFRSPLRLLRDGSPLQEAPSFPALLRAAALRWRLAALSWGVAPPPAQLPEVSVSRMSSEVSWQDFVRHSARQDATLTLGGLVGWAVYEGEWRPAMEYLRKAALLGLGKLTTHGFGQVEFGLQRHALA